MKTWTLCERRSSCSATILQSTSTSRDWWFVGGYLWPSFMGRRSAYGELLLSRSERVGSRLRRPGTMLSRNRNARRQMAGW